MIDTEFRQGIAHVVLNAPERLNAIAQSDWSDLAAALTVQANNPDLRGLTLRGAGKAFCAGADLSLLDDLAGMTHAECVAALSEGVEVVKSLIRFPGPTTSIVDGAAYGIGNSVALACDRVVATPRAKFGFVFTTLGIPAGDTGALWVLARRVGSRAAWRIVERGAVVSADEALALGLVDAIVDAPTDQIAADLDWTAGAPSAVRTTKRQLLEMEGAFAELDAQLAPQVDALATALAGPDFAEGLAAVRERRPAHF
jgi:2-(1,2-epoxy-1,2-dihydrophenyl)acetyl-CoA isomerase